MEDADPQTLEDTEPPRMEDVSAFCRRLNELGARYVVVGFINHPNAMAARPALDTLVEWTAALPD